MPNRLSLSYFFLLNNSYFESSSAFFPSDFRETFRTFRIRVQVISIQKSIRVQKLPSTRAPVSSMMTAFPQDPGETRVGWKLDRSGSVGHAIGLGNFCARDRRARTYQAKPSGLYNTANIINSCHGGKREESTAIKLGARSFSSLKVLSSRLFDVIITLKMIVLFCMEFFFFLLLNFE